MSLTPRFDPLVSLQLSPTSSPTSGHMRNSLSSESSSHSTVTPATALHLQKNTITVQGAEPVKRNRVSQQQKQKVPRHPRKSRSKLTGLATPFHINTLCCPRSIFPPSRLPSRSLKGKTKRPQGITNVDTVGNTGTPANNSPTPIFRREFGSDVRNAGSAGPSLLMPNIPTSASTLESYLAMTAPELSYLQSQQGGGKGSLRIYNGPLAPPARFPVRGNFSRVSMWITPYNYGVASRDGQSEHLYKHSGSSIESENDMAGLSNSGDAESDMEGDDNSGGKSDPNDIVMEGGDKGHNSGDSIGSSSCRDSNANLENDDSEANNTDNNSPYELSLTSSKAKDIKRIRKQPQDGPCTKGDIQMLENNQSTHKETCPIPEKRKVPSPNWASMAVVKTHIKMKSCRSKSIDPVASFKIRFSTHLREKDNKK
ncbi:hypothetical protein H4582DRAFT_2056084 [Lactarius indigo]|nr:hypothetical protein H4582DRAFT_2056084 [Lactarius indigo]